MIKFEVMWRRRAPDNEFSIFSLNMNTILTNFILGMCMNHTFQAKRLEVITELFLDNVLIAIIKLSSSLLKVSNVTVCTLLYASQI